MCIDNPHHVTPDRTAEDTITSKSKVSRWFPIALGALAITALAWWQPAGALALISSVGYAICHQIPERSFCIHGQPLPLCARCTGTFLGVFLGFGMILLRRRDRCSQIPPLPVALAMFLFFAAWAFDGLNSYLTLFERVPSLYRPHNYLRLTTGLLNGLALSSLVYPVFSFTIWERLTAHRSVANFKELGLLLILAAGSLLAFVFEWSPAMYVLFLAGGAGVLLILLLVNTLAAVILLRRENRARRWGDLALPASLGALATFGELALIHALRSYLEGLVSIPW